MAIWNALCISFKFEFDVGTSPREEDASSDADLTPERFSLEEDKCSLHGNLNMAMMNRIDFEAHRSAPRCSLVVP